MGGIDAAQFRHNRLDFVHSGNNIGARRSKHEQGDAGNAVDIAVVPEILYAIGDLRDIAQTNWSAVRICDDQWGVFVGSHQLICRRDNPAVSLVLQQAFWRIGIRRLQSEPYLRQPDMIMSQRHRIQVHADGWFGPAADIHLAHTVHLGNLLRENRVGNVVELGSRNRVRSERKDHDRRVGRVGLPPARQTREVGRKLTGSGINRCLHVAGCRIDVPVQIELNRNARRAELAGGRHFRHAGNPAEGTLQRSCNGRGHRLGACSGKPGKDSDSREIHLRKRCHWKEKIRGPACYQNRQAQQRCGYRTLDKWPGNLHSVLVCGRIGPHIAFRRFLLKP